MKKNIFAVCDREKGYLGSLSDYITRRGNLPFEIQAFTTPEALMEFAARQPIELLLISRDAYTDRLREADIRKIVLLSEGETGGQEESTVYKYQSCADILQETLAAYGEIQAMPAPYTLAKRVSQVYGVYSPAGSNEATSFALALGMELSRRAPTLFITLKGISGLRRLLSLSPSPSLSDLLYYARQKDPTVVMRLGAMVHAREGLDILPPVALLEDVHEARPDDIAYLLEQLTYASVYENFVLDVGDEMGELSSLLSLCHRIFLPGGRGTLEQARREEFLESLTTMGEEALLSKICLVQVREGAKEVSGRNFFSALLWGEMGEIVRETLLREGT